MRAFQRSTRPFVLGILFVAGTTSVALAGDDVVGPKLRTAWQKYSEYLDMSFAYNGRAEISGEIDQLATYRQNLLTNIRNTENRGRRLSATEKQSPGRGLPAIVGAEAGADGRRSQARRASVVPQADGRTGPSPGRDDRSAGKADQSSRLAP